VFSARARQDDQPYSAGTTYFCPCEMKPRCLLEDAVLQIFLLHTKGLKEDGVLIPEQSGAEWWTLVLDDDDVDDTRSSSERRGDKKLSGEEGIRRKPGRRPKDGGDSGDDGHDTSADDEEEDEEGDEVGLHFDADYGLEDQAPNLLLHPRLATVTYLSDVGAPTVVFDRRSPPPDDPEKKMLEGDIRRGWLSHPRVGKHVYFDGRLLHGAPATFFPAAATAARKDGIRTPHRAHRSENHAAGEGGEPPQKRARQMRESRRITLLVNIWINHCPLDAEPLEDDVILQLQPVLEATALRGAEGESCTHAFTVDQSIDLGKEPELPKMSLESSKSDPAGEEEFVLCSRSVVASYGATMHDFHKTCTREDLLELDLGGGVLSLHVGEVVEESSSDEDDCAVRKY